MSVAVPIYLNEFDPQAAAWLRELMKDGLIPQGEAMKTCPFQDCAATIGEQYFACAKHWQTLAPEAQRRIHKAYFGYLEGTLTIEELRRLQQDVLGPRGTA